MILYNSLLTKITLNRKRNKREHYFVVSGYCFTRHKHLEIWESMELWTHKRQYFERFLLASVPSLVPSLLFSWWLMLLALFSCHLLYWAEGQFGYHSSFNWEALEYCGGILYLGKRKFCVWMKWYRERTSPPSGWED